MAAANIPFPGLAGGLPAGAGPVHLQMDLIGPMMAEVTAMVFRKCFSDNAERSEAINTIVEKIQNGFDTQLSKLKNDPRMSSAVIDGTFKKMEAEGRFMLRMWANNIAGIEVYKLPKPGGEEGKLEDQENLDGDGSTGDEVNAEAGSDDGDGGNIIIA